VAGEGADAEEEPMGVAMNEHDWDGGIEKYAIAICVRCGLKSIIRGAYADARRIYFDGKRESELMPPCTTAPGGTGSLPTKG
jgi:hypothetical protein